MVETEGLHSTGIAASDFRRQLEAQTPLGRIGQPDGTSTLWVTVYSPLGLDRLTVDGTEVGAEAGTERGWNAYRVRVDIPAGEIHVEANASETEPLVVVLTRNCPDSHVVYLDGGPDGADDVPAPC